MSSDFDRLLPRDKIMSVMLGKPSDIFKGNSRHFSSIFSDVEMKSLTLLDDVPFSVLQGFRKTELCVCACAFECELSDCCSCINRNECTV